MKTKIILIVVILTQFNLTILGQNVEIEVKYGDEKYMNRNIVFDTIKLEYWELKENLPDGKYYVIKETPCGKDTILLGKYINNIKSGIWIEWQEKMCLVSEDILTGKLLDKTWSNKKYKFYETYYGINEIHKTIGYHPDSDIIHIETIYDKCLETIFYTRKGELEHKNVSCENGDQEILRYSSSGELKYKLTGNSMKSETNKESYFENGQLIANGNSEYFSEFGIAIRNIKLVEHGKWKYFNLSGNLIAEIEFHHGEIKSVSRYRNEKILLNGIEELINK